MRGQNSSKSKGKAGKAAAEQPKAKAEKRPREIKVTWMEPEEKP